VKLELSKNALTLLKKRYLLEGESPEELFRRVAKAVASVEKRYGGDSVATEEEFFRIMAGLEFLPNSPTLMNAGATGQLSACFVLPIDDSLDSIFTTLKNAVMIHHSGGGVGFNFSNIRPKGDLIKTTNGFASGPLNFLKVYDSATEVVKQGGKRSGANMAVLDYDHPDILEFTNAKQKGGLSNFNISIALSDSFMRKVIADSSYWLVNPHDDKRVCRVKARKIFNQIAKRAWENGDPGVIFIDEVNRKHPLNDYVSSTNPCGEQPLLDYESCNLGSINLAKMVINKTINWARLDYVARLAVRFLDNVIDVNKFPLTKIKELTLLNRKIGLGVMGFADLLFQLKVPYDSKKALKIADKIMKFINSKARSESALLGKKKGSFPNLKYSKFKRKHMRNATVTTIAPTGSISLIADCSPSIEPLFALTFMRKMLDDSFMLEVNKYFKKAAKINGVSINEVSKKGSIQKVRASKELKRVFKTALDIKPEWHVKMQAAFQKHVDNAISKTVNMPNKATIKDVAEVIMLAYKLKCKGITVYRYGSKPEQVLTLSCKGECD